MFMSFVVKEKEKKSTIDFLSKLRIIWTDYSHFPFIILLNTLIILELFHYAIHVYSRKNASIIW